jgi:putative peptidoglycan lipid II flippase
VSPWNDATVREVVKKMIPGSIGVAAFQINVLVTQGCTFWFDPSITATFNYAVRLMELPQGVFGISLATFLLPALSGLAAEKKYPEFRGMLNMGLNYISFTNLIAAAVSLALAEPIVRLLFEHGKFGPDATQRVALALACLAPGLLMFSMNNILARAFFALGDIKTPMKISLVCLAVNLAFALPLAFAYREAGLAVANSLSAIINTALLFYALRRRLAKLEMVGLVRNLGILLAASTLAGIAAYGLFRWWDGHYGHDSVATRLGGVFIPMAVAGVIYWSLAMSANVPAARELANLVRRKLRR